MKSSRLLVPCVLIALAILTIVISYQRQKHQDLDQPQESNDAAMHETTATISLSLLSQPEDTQEARKAHYYALVQSLSTIFPETAECPDLDDSMFEWASQFSVVDVKQGKLLSITCFLGAYQGPSIWFYLTPTSSDQLSVTALSFTGYRADGSAYENLMPIGAYYDKETDRVMVFDRGRALGDCGTYARYKLDEENKVLMLERFQLKESCDEQFLPPEEWDVLFE